jgi:ketosteroid isomerase-like protein
MKADATTYTAVKNVLEEWADSYAQRDIQRLLSLITPDTDMVMYGTGADEKRIGLNGIQIQAERDWAQTDAATFTFGEPIISAAGAVAWMAAECTFQVEVGGESMAFPGRFTGVFEKRNGKWLVAQAHFSLPALQEEGESVPQQ